MRSFLALFLTLSFIFSLSLLSPVYAAELDSSPYIDIFDVSSLDLGYVYLNAGQSQTFTTTVERINSRQIEMLVRLDLGTSVTISVNGNNLSRTALYGSTYWLYEFSGQTALSDITVTITNNSSTQSVISISYFRSYSVFYDMPITGTATFAHSSEYSTSDLSTGSISSLSLSRRDSTALEQTFFFDLTISVPEDEVKGLDYVTVSLSFKNISLVGGVTADVGEVACPVTVDYSNGSPEDGYYWLSFRVDLDNIRDDAELNIYINGSLPNNSSVPITAYYCKIFQIQGFMYSGVRNYAYRLLANLKTSVSNISSYFRSWGDKISATVSDIYTEVKNIADFLINGDQAVADAFQDKTENALSDLGDLGDSLNSPHRPDPDNIDVSIDAVVSPGDFAMLSTTIAPIFENNYFSSILLVSFTFALVSFVLFGKK